MRFDPGLQSGDKLTFAQLRNLFQCSNAGGVLPTKKYQTLVIVSNHIKGVADDQWKGDVLHYTGMGHSGDQTIDGNYNQILSESNTNGVTVHLFEVYVQNEYIYKGIVKLVQEPYQEFQKESDGSIRRVWVFPVKVVGNAREEDEAEERRLTERVMQIPDEELESLTFSYRKSPKRREKPIWRNGVEVYRREERTAVHALVQADYHCEVDHSHEMILKYGSSYPRAIVRHLIPMRYAKEFSHSLDVEENIVVLCPACETMLLYGQEREALLHQLYEARKELLQQAGIGISFSRLKEMYE